MKSFLIAAGIAIITTTTAAAQTPPAPAAVFETVSVSGTGHSNVAPDRFTFTVGVQTVAPTVDQAVNENNQKVASVLAALRKAGATEKDIRTSNFAIWPQQDYTQGNLPRILGYQVSNSITVRRSNIAEAGKLLQVAVNAGVNQSSGLQFEVSDPARGRDEGLRSAFADARSKAVLLAQAAGRTLGRVLTVSEGGQAVQPPYPMPRMMAMKAEAGQAVSDIPVEPGSQESTYTVSVVFELR